MTREWVRLPAKWIGDGGLRDFRWAHGGQGSDQVAALMILIVIAHSTDPDSGRAQLTYDDITSLTTLSRAKVSRGLHTLEGRELITRRTDGGRSVVGFTNYDADGWAKLPCRSMYAAGRIRAFDDFTLRKVVQLDALKLFLLFAQRRDRRTNLANIGYDKIEEYTGIVRARIKPAISFLASFPLVYVEHLPSKQALGVSSAYRLVGVEPRVHMGTRGRGMIDA